MKTREYVIVKYSSDEKGIHSCCLSGLTLDDLYSVFGSPSKVLLTYNEANEVRCLNETDFLEIAQNRAEYYDIVCSDIKSDLVFDETYTENNLKKFVNINTPNRVIWMPPDANSFCIYSHDKSLFSYICFNMEEKSFIKEIYKKILKKSGVETNIPILSDTLDTLLELFKNGVIIDITSVKESNGSLEMEIARFNENDSFFDWVYLHNEPYFERILLMI